MDIAYRTNPKVIFLENVKNILSHADGLTFKFIKQLFEGIGYNLFHAVQNPYKHGNIPQTRDRVFFVAFRNDLNITDFEFPKPIPLTKTIKDCLESQVNFKYYYKDDHIHMDKMKSMIVSQDTAYQLRRVYIRENKKNLCPTLTANMGQGGNNVPLILDSVGIRKLTPRECFNLMGFPTDYKLPPNMADCHLYKQSGNSIVVPIIERITEVILDKLNIE